MNRAEGLRRENDGVAVAKQAQADLFFHWPQSGLGGCWQRSASHDAGASEWIFCLTFASPIRGYLPTIPYKSHLSSATPSLHRRFW